MTLGIHLMKNPAGTFSFVGSIPVQLVWLNKDGSELTDPQAKQVARANTPAMLAKTRVFPTIAEAITVAGHYGIASAEIKISEKDRI